MSAVTGGSMFDMADVAKHSTKDDCWVVIHGKVYDLTAFARVHPGGPKLIHDCAGKDGTLQFATIHPKDLADKILKPSYNKGLVDPTTMTTEHIAKAPPKPAKVEASGESTQWRKPPLGAMLNTFDFESVARRVMEPQGWGYYSSGGDDEITLRDNHLAFQRVVMRPRILVNVKNVDTRTHVLGVPSALPLYFTATALGGLAHPDAETAIVRAAGKAGLVYMLPTLSTSTLDEMLAARVPGQVVFSQLYVNPERSRTEDYVRSLREAGVQALFVTVDAPQLGRREKDMRNKFSRDGASEQADEEGDSGSVDRSQGAARAISSFIDASLCWDDLPWLKSLAGDMKVLLKGVQCGEDAVLAYQAGLAGCVLSNHGGRQLDTCRSGIEVLPEVMEALRSAGASKQDFAVFVDGGIRRGADVFKAIALGATACGVGRPVLYSLASYGERGIVRMVDLLQDELTMAMRLSGTPNVRSITPGHVITKNLGDHFVPQPPDNLTYGTYEPLLPAARL